MRAELGSFQVNYSTESELKQRCLALIISESEVISAETSSRVKSDI